MIFYLYGTLLVLSGGVDVDDDDDDLSDDDNDDDLLPVLHTACPLWVSAKGKRTIAAPLYDKTVSPFQNIL